MASAEVASADEMVQMTWACLVLLVLVNLLHRVDKHIFR